MNLCWMSGEKRDLILDSQLGYLAYASTNEKMHKSLKAPFSYSDSNYLHNPSSIIMLIMRTLPQLNERIRDSDK